jgi:hypothetical protein
VTCISGGKFGVERGMASQTELTGIKSTGLRVLIRGSPRQPGVNKARIKVRVEHRENEPAKDHRRDGNLAE